MLQIFTKDGCRTGSQRNSFLYADKEKKLPFILKKKDIRINRNMTAKELKIGTPVALQKKLTTFHFNDILLSINFHEGVASVYDTYQVNILTEWSGLFLIARLMYSGFLYVKSIYFRNSTGYSDVCCTRFFMQKTGNCGMENRWRIVKWNGVYFLYSTVYCLV